MMNPNIEVDRDELYFRIVVAANRLKKLFGYGIFITWMEHWKDEYTSLVMYDYSSSVLNHFETLQTEPDFYAMADTIKIAKMLTLDYGHVRNINLAADGSIGWQLNRLEERIIDLEKRNARS